MELLDRQKIKKISKKKLKKYLKQVFSLLLIEKKSASFVFCDNDFISCLNQEYFNRKCPTDVISFPLADEFPPGYLGEVVVSVEKAVESAAGLGLDWQRELLLYLIHGIMHLIGFKDSNSYQKKKMRRRETEILESFRQVNVSL